MERPRHQCGRVPQQARTQARLIAAMHKGWSVELTQGVGVGDERTEVAGPSVGFKCKFRVRVKVETRFVRVEIEWKWNDGMVNDFCCTEEPRACSRCGRSRLDDVERCECVGL